MVTGKEYIPNRGDIVWLNCTPQSGHEQKGKRHALILSPQTYNKKSGLALCCPITSREKGYPFEVVLKGETIKGVILADQIKSLDWQTRQVQFIEHIAEDSVNMVLEMIKLLL
ncbi:MAG: endoribonuclease MazF [bacterium]